MALSAVPRLAVAFAVGSVMTLDAIIDEQFRRARRGIIGSRVDETRPALFCGYGDSAQVFVMVSPFTDAGRSKDIATGVARELLRVRGCTAYALVSETWFYVTTETIRPGQTMTPASQHPDRRDGLMIYAENKTGERLGLTWEVMSQHGQVTDLVQITGEAGTFTSGRFGGLLQPARPN